LASNENIIQTHHPKILKAASRVLDSNRQTKLIDLLKDACDNHENQEVIRLIKELVPEYNSQGQQRQTSALN
jgi:FlaA1/EpsC-like NDP-sugar epimerase